MINRDEFSKVLDDLRDARALLAAERHMHARLRRRVEEHGKVAGRLADKAIRESSGRPTVEWQRASAEHAAALSILRADA